MVKLVLGFLPLILTGLLLLGEGLVFGFLTNRWGPSPELQAAASRLYKVPRVLGEWQGEDRPPLGDREAQQAGFSGYVLRGYRNARTGASVSILLACGRSGPICVHTPDICYRGSGYVPKNMARTVVEPDHAQFFNARFGKPNSPEPRELRILWSWNAHGEWKAPDNTRVGFAGAKVLYKLYVIQEVTGDDSQAESIGNEFLRSLLPALNQALFPKS